MARRRKGSGRLMRRGEWWYLRVRQGGRETVRALGTRSRAEAERMTAAETEVCALRARAARIDALRALAEGADGELRRRIEGAREMPLGSLAEAFLDSPRRPDCGAGTLEIYRGAADDLARFLGADRAAQGVDAADAERYARHVGGALAAGTYNKRINALAAIWRVLAPAMGTAGNPWEGIARKRARPHVRRALTAAEVDALLGSAEGEVRTLIAIGAYTGLRMGDACRLRWEDLQGGVVRVTTGKTGAKVAVPMHPRLAEILGPAEGRRGAVVPGLVATHRRDPSAVSKAVRRAFEAAGVRGETAREGARNTTDCSFHSLRHTFVTRAMEAGISPAIVQALVGHASAAMTERYTHISDEAVLAAFRRI